MDYKKFFDTLRNTVFNGSLSQEQVTGIEAILAACNKYGVTDLHHVANILAQVRRETGGYMLGIKETVYASHKNKNPSDAEVVRRLDRAWAKGQLGKVRTPYWRDGAFGRGPIQLTHWENYEKFAKRLGVPLRQNPSLALDPTIGAEIAVVGMSEGMFRRDSKGPLSLSRYTFPKDLDNAPDTNPRRIVNGKDGSDKEVASAHRLFYKALVDANSVSEIKSTLNRPEKPVQSVPAPEAPALPPRPEVAVQAPVEEADTSPVKQTIGQRILEAFIRLIADILKGK